MHRATQYSVLKNLSGNKQEDSLISEIQSLKLEINSLKKPHYTYLRVSARHRTDSNASDRNFANCIQQSCKGIIYFDRNVKLTINVCKFGFTTARIFNRLFTISIIPFKASAPA